jgi:hypothetical protein
MYNRAGQSLLVLITVLSISVSLWFLLGLIALHIWVKTVG